VERRTCLVITSISAPTGMLRRIAADAQRSDFDLIIIGDVASPDDFELEGCDFYSLDSQRDLDLTFAGLCPTGHYTRKNIGYLLAMQRGATAIVETDDDTVAYESFWEAPRRSRPGRRLSESGWINVYRYFSKLPIWPRGFPLDEAQRAVPALEGALEEIESPIQQGLIDDDPDVDAIYRLLFELPFRFRAGPSVALPAGAWCPFNSQNTTWWPEAYPLLYLPATCSFRMTDIWRSFIAQRIAWANSWQVMFHGPTISQSRNAHDMMRDFRDEMPGYLENKAIRRALEGLTLEAGAEHLASNMRLSYEALVDRGLLESTELPLLDAWLADVASMPEVSQTREARL
jgi:STELLO glycosyltransferases